MCADLLYSVDADRDGPGRRSLAHRCTTGELVRIRPGVYLDGQSWTRLSPWERERLRLAAAVESGRSKRVLIQQSAAAVWGMPTIGTPREVMLLALPPVNGHRRGDLRWARRRLLEPLTTVDGLPVTSRAQTVLDMAAYLPFEQAVPAMDHVIRPDRRRGLQALEKSALRQLAQGLPTQSKRVRVKRVIDFADARSESPGESYSRALMYRHGLPIPDLQRELHGPDGRLLGRTDFYWEEENLVGEFDGAVKYGAALGGNLQQGRDALVQEKRREDRLRATGVGFVRWTWSEAIRPSSHPEGLLQILLQAGLTRRKHRRC